MQWSPERVRRVASRAAGLVLLVLGTGVGGAWALRRGDIRFVLYEAVPWPNLPWLAGSLVCAGLALALVHAPSVWRTSLTSMAVIGAAACLAWMIASPVVGAGRGTEVDSFLAPQGHFRVVVYAGGFFDPLYFVSIEQLEGPLARSWFLGCLDGDYEWIEDAGWQSAEVFEASTSVPESAIRIRVESGTGRPVETTFPSTCHYRP